MDASRSERPQVVLAARCIIANEQNELLFVKRNSSDTFNPGLWEFPGGKLDTDQDVHEALRREVKEETNLTVEPKLPLYCTETYVMERGKYKGLAYMGLFGLARANGGHVAISHEHEDKIWTPVEQVDKLDLTDETVNALRVLGATVLGSFLDDEANTG